MAKLYPSINATNSNTPYAIVSRDSSGGFSCGTITASGIIMSASGLVINLNADMVDGAHASGVSTANAIPIANSSGKLSSGWLTEVLALSDLSDVAAKTGTGTTVVMSSTPTLSVPVIASFASATHNHQSSTGGGTLTSSAISNFDTQVRTNRLDQMANPTTSVSMNSQKITNLLGPASSSDAANKGYVDNAASSGNAITIKGTSVDATNIGNLRPLIFRSSTGNIEYQTIRIGSGIIYDQQVFPKTSVDFNYRVLYNENEVAKVSWASGIVIQDESALSILNNRTLCNSVGRTTVDFDNQTLKNFNGAINGTVFDWVNGFAMDPVALQISIDWSNRKLQDSNALDSVKWNTRELIQSDSSTVALNWGSGMPLANSVQSGYLTSADWTTFNNKVGSTRTISTTSPLSGGGDLSTNRTLSISVASTGTSGYLIPTDWNTFNNKVGTSRSISTTLPLTGGGDLSSDRTLSMPQASGTASGYLSSSDWTIFNNKVGTTRSISTTAPLAGGGTLASDLTLSIPVASASTSGYLNNTDWTTFNNKVSSTRSINTTLPLTGGGDLSSDRTIAIPQASGTASGYLSAGDWTTFNNKVSSTRAINTTFPITGGGDLSIDRTIAMAAASTSSSGYLTAGDWNSFDNARYDHIGFGTDGGTSLPGSGLLGIQDVYRGGTLVGWTILANASGTCYFDIKKSTYANYPSTTSIFASGLPSLATANNSRKAQNNSLDGGVTISVANGDVFEGYLINPSGSMTKVGIKLYYKVN